MTIRLRMSEKIDISIIKNGGDFILMIDTKNPQTTIIIIVNEKFLIKIFGFTIILLIKLTLYTML